MSRCVKMLREPRSWVGKGVPSRRCSEHRGLNRRRPVWLEWHELGRVGRD